MKADSSGKWIGAGLLTAVAASLCCITPVLALVAGTSGLAAGFSWLEPFRPYLIGLTVLVLGFAWYQKLKPRATEVDCDCEEDGKVSFWHSKTFLGIVTVFAGLMLAFPHYAGVFFPDNSAKVTVVREADLQTVHFDIRGMTCTGCEEHVKHAVNELPGIVDVQASYKEGSADVQFDRTKTTPEEIKAAIDKTGYKVTDYRLAASTSEGE